MNNVLGIPILSIITFLPLLGAIVLFFFPRESKEGVRATALVFTLVNLVISIALLNFFDQSTHEMQFVEKAAWIPGLGIEYFMGMDGISMLLVLLTTLTSFIAVLCSWSAIEERVKEYMIHILILETGMIGVFTALDMILFFVFWEIGLVPMFFLIGVWGGPRKLYANIKFFLYTLFGSVFMLVGILALYYSHGQMTGEYTFNLLKLYETAYPYSIQWWVFVAFFLGFAIKVPVFPFHTWLPDAHVEAPTAGSVILAAVLLKMGTYGFLRFNLPLMPEASAAFMPFILVLSVIGIIYGAFLAMAQNDIKKLVAYSSVSHLGAVMAGLFALNQQGIDGGMLQMINHGISTGGLFLVIGMIYERRHTRLIKDFGGIAKVMPLYAALVMIIVFSSIGLPGTNGFIGEILILIGLFKAHTWAGVLAATGVILGAAYMLWMSQRVFFGKITNHENEYLEDINLREFITLVPIIALIIWIGVYPKHFTDISKASTAHIVEMMNKRGVGTAPLNSAAMMHAGAVEKAASQAPAANAGPSEALAATREPAAHAPQGEHK